MTHTTEPAGTAAGIVTPRLGQWDEAQEYGNIAAAAGSDEERKFYYGARMGMLAAFTGWEVWQLVLRQSKHAYYARALPYPEAANLLGMLPAVTAADRDLRLRAFEASGVLFGYKQGTAELDGAEECMVCEARVLPHDEGPVRCRVHGTFCSRDCAVTHCTAGLCEGRDWQ